MVHVLRPINTELHEITDHFISLMSTVAHRGNQWALQKVLVYCLKWARTSTSWVWTQISSYTRRVSSVLISMTVNVRVFIYFLSSANWDIFSPYEGQTYTNGCHIHRAGHRILLNGKSRTGLQGCLQALLQIWCSDGREMFADERSCWDHVVLRSLRKIKI